MVAAAIVAIVIIFLYYHFDPATAGFFPRCPSKYFFGYDCPGCGSQRALHALLHGDFAAAFAYNAYLFFIIPFLFLFFFSYVFRNRFPRLHAAVDSTVSAVIVLVLTIAWWIVRNLI